MTTEYVPTPWFDGVFIEDLPGFVILRHRSVLPFFHPPISIISMAHTRKSCRMLLKCFRGIEVKFTQSNSFCTVSKRSAHCISNYITPFQSLEALQKNFTHLEPAEAWKLYQTDPNRYLELPTSLQVDFLALLAKYSDRLEAVQWINQFLSRLPKVQPEHLYWHLRAMFDTEKSILSIRQAFETIKNFGFDWESDCLGDIYELMLRRAIWLGDRETIKKVYSQIEKHALMDLELFKKIIMMHRQSKNLADMLDFYRVFNGTQYRDPMIYDALLSTWIENDEKLTTMQLLSVIFGLDFNPLKQTVFSILKTLIKQNQANIALEIIQILRLTNSRRTFSYLWTRREFRNQKELDAFMKPLQIHLLESDVQIPLKSLQRLLMSMADGARRRNDFESFCKVDEYIKNHKIEQSSELLSSIIACHLEFGNLEEADVLIEMLQGHPKPCQQMYLRIIQAYLNINEFDKATAAYEQMLAGTKMHPPYAPQAAFLHVFLVYFAEKKDTKNGLAFYKRMIDDGGRPNSRVYEVLLELCIGHPVEIDLIWNDLISWSAEHSFGGLNKCGVNLIHYSHLATHMIKQGDEAGLKKVLQSQTFLRREVYLNIAKMVRRAGDLESCENILKSMEKVGYKPCNWSFSILLHAYRDAGDMEKFEATISRMYQLGIQLNRHNYEDIVCTYINANQFKKAMKILSEMEKANFGVARLKQRLKYRMHLLGQGNFQFHYDKIQASPRFKKWIERLQSPREEEVESDELDAIHQIVAEAFLMPVQ